MPLQFSIKSERFYEKKNMLDISFANDWSMQDFFKIVLTVHDEPPARKRPIDAEVLNLSLGLFK